MSQNHNPERLINLRSNIFTQDDTSKTNSAANELGLANVGGVFVVLMGGMGVACVVAVFEFVWKSRKIAVEERVREQLGSRRGPEPKR